MAERNEASQSTATSTLLPSKVDPTSARFEANMRFMADLVSQVRNEEEKIFSKHFNAPIINGSTPIEKRIELVDAFKKGEINKIVSKPSVLGFGVNIQEAESHLYSGYNFSFEEFYQAVRRSHRYGRNGRLKVFVPVSEPEKPIWDILQRKLNTFEKDVIELQKRFFN